MMNTFTILLKELGVKHTTSFATKLYNEHPYRNSFYGLSKMLSEYKIENIGIRIKDKNQLINYPTPYIAQFGDQLITVKSVSNNGDYTFYWKDQDITLPKDQFNELWKGVVLLTEIGEDSAEPQYKKHRQEIFIRRSLITSFIISIIVLLSISIYQHALYKNTILWGLLLLNGSGFYITYLLLKKELHISDRYGDKICSLFKKASCNTILESKASKIAGTFSWSEIGVSYFATNLLISIFLPSLYGYLALINICTLPFSFWSVWYQGKVMKSWCPLCLLSISVLWMIFLFNILTDNFPIRASFAITEFAQTGILYFILLTGIILLLPLIKKARKLPVITQHFNHIRNKDEVFEALLKKSTYYEVTNEDSQIILGNQNAKIQLTLLTNPHCEPCAITHRRINRLLPNISEKVCVRYIFSSFNKELEESNKALISLYLNHKELSEDAFNEWFDNGKYQREQFYKKHPITNSEKVEEEFEKHITWKEKNKLSATPTVLVNGYQLPDEYIIEDLIFITQLNL